MKPISDYCQSNRSSIRLASEQSGSTSKIHLDIAYNPEIHRFHPKEFLHRWIIDPARKLEKELVRTQKHLESQESNDLYRFTTVTVDKSSPDIETISQLFGSTKIGLSLAQGKSATMEDNYVVAQCQSALGDGTLLQYDLFSVIDGHDGCGTAEFIAKHAKETFEEAIGKYGSSDAGMRAALKHACLQLNADVITKRPEDLSQAAAIFCIKIGSQLWVANVGNCRAIAVINSDTMQLSQDAKPNIQRFKKGIENGGGMARLVTSARAFHCHNVIGKDGYSAISSRPKISKLDIPQDASVFLIAASHGIWDIATSTDVGSVVASTKDYYPPEDLAFMIVKKALLSGAEDNCTALIARLNKT